MYNTAGSVQRSLQGLAEQALKIGRRARAWIGLMANISLGDLH
jgi:hypothetical protein